MAQIICLANSWKHGARCVAGMEPHSGRWIRPVTGDTDDGRVDARRLIDRREPALLDILELPLGEDGPDFGFESENRLILPGPWQKVGRAGPKDLIPYVDHGPCLLHNRSEFVEFEYLSKLPKDRRITLQLVETTELSCTSSRDPETGRAKWRVQFSTVDRLSLDLPITDPESVSRLNHAHTPSQRCLITLSLGMPMPPQGKQCYKLAAGIVEIR